MCGIAGYSLDPESDVERTLAAQALLAAIAERGADAVGYAHRGAGREITVHKQRTGASALLEAVDVPSATTEVLVHVRDYTKGHPRIEANNHPIRHGAVVGIHNGMIVNDEEIFSEYGFGRAAPDMTVDSEAIFALVDHAPDRGEVLEGLCGSMATAWLDLRRRDVLFLARGSGRPLWLGSSSGETFFASTRLALEVVEDYTGLTLHKRELDEGTFVALRRGRELWRQSFEPDRDYVETPLPSVRAPHEGAFCLQRLAALRAA